MSIDTILSWLPFIGGGGLIAWVVLAMVAPSVTSAVSAWLVALSPLGKGFSEGAVNFVSALWEGAMDMLDNGKSLLFVLTVALGALWYGGYYQKQKQVRPSKTTCEVCIADLRKQYIFTPRKGAPPAKQAPSQAKPWWPF